MFDFFKRQKKLSMKREKVDVKNINDVRNILMEGDEGEDVKKLQKMLIGIEHICPNVSLKSADGIFNSKTKGAIENFQKIMGIDSTGVVDSITWERLNLIYAKKNEIKAIEKIEFNNLIKKK